MTGRSYGCSFGISDLPGHYTMTVERNVCGGYDYASSSYEAAGNVAHEIGHNFFGQHYDGDTYYVAVYKTVCELPVLPILGCLKSHQEVDYYQRHQYILTTDPYHQPPNYYVENRFGSTSQSQINNCNNGNWGTLSYNYQGSWVC